MSNNAGEKFFTGLIVGTVLGIAIGMLTTPKSGVETRGMVKEKMTDIGNRVKEAVEKARKSD